MKAKILIIGGGGMGTSIALHAATRCDPLDEPVLLIERDRLGAGSSGRSGAIVHAAYSDRVLCGMARDSLKQYVHFTTHTGRSRRCLAVTHLRAKHAPRVHRAARIAVNTAGWTVSPTLYPGG